MARIQLRRGLKENLPTSGMLAGEAHVTTDRGTLHVATDATTKIPVVPAIDDLTTLASVDGTADLLIIHDASATFSSVLVMGIFNAALKLSKVIFFSFCPVAEAS
jgi:hypothetical protein